MALLNLGKKSRLRVLQGSQVYRLQEEAIAAEVPHGVEALFTIHGVEVGESGQVYFCFINGVTLHSVISGTPDYSTVLPGEANIEGKACLGQNDLTVQARINGSFDMKLVRARSLA